MSLSKISTKARLLTALGAILFVAAGALAFNLNFASAEDAKDWLAEGDKQFTEKSYLKAYEAYEKYLKAEPKSEQAFRIKLRMGKCQSQLEGYDKAEEIYKGLADDAGLNETEKARANYHFGLFYSTRPHYYYENSKK